MSATTSCSSDWKSDRNVGIANGPVPIITIRMLLYALLAIFLNCFDTVTKLPSNSIPVRFRQVVWRLVHRWGSHCFPELEENRLRTVRFPLVPQDHESPTDGR